MLRTLISAIVATVFSFTAILPALAQEAAGDPDPLVEFAPGSKGPVEAPLARHVDEARKLGKAWGKTLNIQEPAEGAFGSIDFESLRKKALNNPRVRSLLKIPDEATGDAREQTRGPRYEGSRIFLLASFSMPESSLRQMMAESERFGLPVIFRGFVNNSVYETAAALERLEVATGFSIDPTMFTRFRIGTVPHVIGVDMDIDVCETAGCEDDPVPPHDKVSGNVPLEFALRLIAQEGEVAADEARRLLDEAKQ